jgi:hypothetical protein
MNGKKVKWLRKLVSTKNPVLLLLIRNKYGESTQGMDYDKLFNITKKLYKKGEIQKIKGWPTMSQMRKMKGNVVLDELLIPGTKTE